MNPELMSSSSTEPTTARDGGAETRSGASIQLAIYDAQNNLVRRLKVPQGPAGTGIQRAVWDPRHPLPDEAAGGAGRETKRGRHGVAWTPGRPIPPTRR